MLVHLHTFATIWEIKWLDSITYFCKTLAKHALKCFDVGIRKNNC